MSSTTSCVIPHGLVRCQKKAPCTVLISSSVAVGQRLADTVNYLVSGWIRY